MRSAKGITILELVVAVAILGVLLGIGFVLLPRDRFAVNQAAEGLRADVELARFQAIRSGGFVRLAIEPGDDAYRLVEVEWDGSAWGELAVLKEVPLSGPRTPPVEIGAASSFNDLYFDPRGNGIGQGAQSIVLESATSDYARTVSISQQGRVEIQ